MTKFDDCVKDIDKMLRTPSITKHEDFRDWIKLFGEALHDFIENHDFKPDNTGKAKGKDVTDGQDKVLIPKLLSKYSQFSAPAPRDYMDDIAVTEQGKAAQEVAGAAAQKTKNRYDDASEDYVNAAVSYFRAALCYYIEGNLSSPDYGDQTVIDTAYKYAQMLIAAANQLNDAKSNEDSTDYSEIIAELIVSIIFFKEASKALTNLENGAQMKGVTFNPATKTNITNAKNTADNGATTNNSTLNAHVK